MFCVEIRKVITEKQVSEDIPFAVGPDVSNGALKMVNYS
jgi:hypothetical protein